MKKIISSTKMLAALLIAGAAYTACSNNDDTNEQPMPSQKAYTLIVNASKGNEATTRALSFSGSTLSATWSEGDEVKVYKGDTEIGTLTAQNSGANTTLKGNLTSAPSVGDNLILKFLSPDYTAQEGTLEYIAANCDYAVANITVSTVNTTEKTITTTDNADFQNQQAIVKFTLTDNATTPAAISALKLRVTANSKTYIVTPSSATDVLYVAIAEISSKNINLVANVNGDIYTYAKSGVTFVNSKYYTISVRMRQVEAIDLGLPSGTKWANMNIGAMVPEGYGGFYAWGETSVKETYNWDTYNYGNSSSCDDLGDISGSSTYDVARVNWGGTWRMPTIEEYNELKTNCTWTWTTICGIGGDLVTGPNGNTIFLPATGYKWYSSWDEKGSIGYYWLTTGMPDPSHTTAYDFYFNKDFNSGAPNDGSQHRYVGYVVRAVTE